MGGKVWSETEERHFWRVAVAQSPKRCGIDQAKAERSWEELAREMQVVMGTRARRQYSGTMLCKPIPSFPPLPFPCLLGCLT
ncbi:hypothetical protein GGS20DRAFT_552906, partial [Poronia punctata]